MKKLFVLFTALALLVSSLCTVSYADSSANYFEPVYNEENWTVSAPEGSSITFDSDAKSIVTKGSGVKTATYKVNALSGDVILTFDAKFGGSNSGNHNKITLGSMIFDFVGDKTFGFTGGNDTKEKVTNNGYEKNTSGNSIVIVYKTTGEVNVYDVTSTEQKTVYSYTGSDIADKNDGTLVVEDRYATSITVSNIKMYKPNSTFFDDFEGSTDLSAKWDLYIADSNEDKQYKTITVDNDETNHYMSVKGSYNPKNIAMARETFMSGSYTISTYFTSANNNKQCIYFNKLSDSAYYALQISQDGTTKKYILDIMKNTDSLANITGEASLSSINNFKIEYLAENGKINIYVNDETTPKLTATDDTYKMGKVGVRLANSRIDNFKIEPISAETPEFSVGAISVSGDIAANSTVTGSATVKNTTNENKEAVIVMAIYKNGEISNVIKTDGAFTAKSGENPFSVSYTFGEIQEADNYKVKCFVFNSLESIVPLTHATEKPVEA